MKPEEFLFKTYSITIQNAFAEVRLGGRYAADLLKLPDNDSRSLEKIRMCVISMSLCLSYRAATEAFIDMYGSEFALVGGSNKLIIQGAKLFDSIVIGEFKNNKTPAYVDSSYFQRWRNRYEDVVLNKNDPLKIKVLSVFLKQSTFEYDGEPAASANENLVLFYGDNIYDNYVTGLRNLLGEKVLK